MYNAPCAAHPSYSHVPHSRRTYLLPAGLLAVGALAIATATTGFAASSTGTGMAGATRGVIVTETGSNAPSAGSDIGRDCMTYMPMKDMAFVPVAKGVSTMVTPQQKHNAERLVDATTRGLANAGIRTAADAQAHGYINVSGGNPIAHWIKIDAYIDAVLDRPGPYGRGIDVNEPESLIVAHTRSNPKGVVIGAMYQYGWNVVPDKSTYGCVLGMHIHPSTHSPAMFHTWMFPHLDQGPMSPDLSNNDIKRILFS